MKSSAKAPETKKGQSLPNWPKSLILLVETERFEHSTPCTPFRCEEHNLLILKN
jgi:hypothetical protein